MPSMDLWIERYLRRLQLGQFLHRAAEWLAGFLLAFGGIVLIVKLAIPQAWPHVLWLGLLAIPMAGAAWYVSHRERFTRLESIALLDRKLETGGLIMALAETRDPRWIERLPQAERLWRESLPRFRPVRFSRYVALPLLFAAGACLVPLREAHTEPILRNTVGVDAAKDLEETLELLEEAKILEEEEREQMREAIEQLAQDAQHTPLTHEKWETVDALRERLRVKVDAATMSLAKGNNAARALLEALGQNADLTSEQLAQLEQDVLETLRKMNQNAPAGTPQASKTGKGLSSELQRLMKDGRFSSDPSERQKQLEDLQEYLDQESRRLEELRKQCQKCNGGQCPGGQCLGGECSDCEGGNSSKDGDGKPGRGGISRGRGDAPISFGEESDEQGAKFKDVVLPEGLSEDPSNQVTRIEFKAPEETPAESAPRSAARQSDPASGRETWNRTLRPRHRDVVRQYFDEK